MIETAEEIAERKQELQRLEREAERLVTVREVFEAGFKRGLAKAGLTSHADDDYDEWLLSRDR